MEEQEAEKQRDKWFNDIRPMVPTKQVWVPKQVQSVVVSTSVTSAPIPPKEDDATAITSSTTPIDSAPPEQIPESMNMP